MKENSVKINKLLLPISWLYGLGVWVRNKMFDWKILKSQSFDIPIICIGNLTVGGTGKTPHTEYLIRLLKNEYNVAVISRGYKRKTKGFILADSESTADTIGDEPCQMKGKFPEIKVAVDEKRCHAVEEILKSGAKTDVILLDDAFQHRYVKAGINILLTRYDRLFINDTLMPAGRLREQKSGKDRANIIIVTKCPQDMNPIDYRIKINEIKPYPYQQVFFTTFQYGELKHISREEKRTIKPDDNILLLTGIANPEQMHSYLLNKTGNIETMSFPDHHNFTAEDIAGIIRKYGQDAGKEKYIVTTEKDATRLRLYMQQLGNLFDRIYVLPIEVKFLLNKEEKFNKKIKDYVRKDTRNGSIS